MSSKEKDKICFLFVCTSCKRSGPIQVMFNVLKNMDKTLFSIHMITFYDETKEESMLSDFLNLDIVYHKVPLRKFDILLGNTGSLKKLLNNIKPDVIHSVGVFPNYVISRFNNNIQIITLHNFMKEDLIPKYGRIKGTILEIMEMYSIRRAKKVVTCSKSLAEMYKEKCGFTFDAVQNGVDTDRFNSNCNFDKNSLRERLNLPLDKVILVYAGQMIERKNQTFLLKTFKEYKSNLYLLLLGDGELFRDLSKKYKNSNVDFRGNVNNVNEFLHASDVYISTSKSEGMPIGVLEAMASGLPIVLSDIPQHKELFEGEVDIGYIFLQDDKKDLIEKIEKITKENYKDMGKKACELAQNVFSAKKMSEKYQELYIAISNENYSEY